MPQTLNGNDCSNGVDRPSPLSVPCKINSHTECIASGHLLCFGEFQGKEGLTGDLK